MKIYRKENVLEAALDRIRDLYEMFDNIVVSFSGGKDSTVILNLCLQVAREKKRLPLPVMFIDQECEWQSTIDYVKKVMYDKDVKPYWYQMPMVITNNASSTSRYHYCWNEEEKDEWIHPQDKLAITENTYGTDKFHDLFIRIARKDFPENTACIAGVRTEEAPKRFVVLTTGVTYKYITWGKQLNKNLNQFTFYPIYDWSYTDVWKYIQENNLPYNKIYDEYYRHGMSIKEMRVSNLHHETAIQSLLIVQELEPETWNKVAKKIEGANTIKHMQKESFTCPKELPYMFKDWKEYALHLAKNLIPEKKHLESLYKKIEETKLFHMEASAKDYWRIIINTILSSDFDFTKLVNFKMSSHCDTLRRYIKNPQGKNKEKYQWIKPMRYSTKYLNNKQKLEILDYFINESNKK